MWQNNKVINAHAQKYATIYLQRIKLLLPIKLFFVFYVIFLRHILHMDNLVKLKSTTRLTLTQKRQKSMVQQIQEQMTYAQSLVQKAQPMIILLAKHNKTNVAKQMRLFPILLLYFSFIFPFLIVQFVRNNENRWRPQQNSNLHLILRRDLFYPVEL